jgi:hypothetical protein
MREDLPPPAIAGQWYLGVPCSHCDEMVLFAVDLSRGHGTLAFFDAGETAQERCVRGHLTTFRLDELRRFQWRPRRAGRAWSHNCAHHRW